jgi:transcription elongation factor
VRYNDQIWIRGAYGTESTYPMNYFSKPAGVAGAEANEKSDPKAESKQ